MRPPYKPKTYSRRDFLFGLINRYRSDAFWGESTGFDPGTREADGYLKAGELDKAAELLEEMLQKSPDHVQARQKLAYCYLQADKPERAASEFRKVLQRGREDNFTFLYLGLAQAKLGRLSEAVETWKGYFNVDRPLIQRALNLQIALFDSDAATPQDMVQSIEQAIEEQQSMG
jgi:tetratricopeptide (TPR) repeat protein